MSKTIKETIQDFINEKDVESAIPYLFEQLTKIDINYNSLLMMRHQFDRLENNQRRGLISKENYNIGYNRLLASLEYFVDTMEEVEEREDSAEEREMKQKILTYLGSGIIDRIFLNNFKNPNFLLEQQSNYNDFLRLEANGKIEYGDLNVGLNRIGHYVLEAFSMDIDGNKFIPRRMSLEKIRDSIEKKDEIKRMRKQIQAKENVANLYRKMFYALLIFAILLAINWAILCY